MIQERQKQIEKGIYEEQEKRKKGEIYFQLCIFPACLRDRASGDALVIGMSGQHRKEDLCRPFPIAEWFPGVQTGPGGHFKLQSGISRMPFWKNFLTEVSSEQVQIQVFTQHLLILLKGKEVFSYKRDFLHPNSLCVLSNEVLILIFLCSTAKSL